MWRGPLHITRQLIVAMAVVIAVTVTAVELAPFAELLQLAAFPVGGWLAVIATAAVTTLWTEPWKGRRSSR